MMTQSQWLYRAVARGAVAFSLAAAPLPFAAGAMAQTAVVSANAPTNPHDAAVAAAAKGDYIGALELAKQAAAAGQPLDADQIDFMTGKAARQQAILDEAAKAKATQVAAQGTAEQIMARQQKDYADRAAAAATKKRAKCEQGQMGAESLSQALGNEQGQGTRGIQGTYVAPPPGSFSSGGCDG